MHTSEVGQHVCAELALGHMALGLGGGRHVTEVIADTDAKYAGWQRVVSCATPFTLDAHLGTGVRIAPDHPCFGTEVRAQPADVRSRGQIANTKTHPPRQALAREHLGFKPSDKPHYAYHCANCWATWMDAADVRICDALRN